MPNSESKRLLSLDVFRGLTIAGMIVVNSNGSDSVFPWVAHAPWNGCTLADLVFPSFLVIMGVSLTISLSRRRAQGGGLRPVILQILRRTFVIFAFGLISSAILFDFNSIHDLRIMGVLQRIAICYFGCSLLYLFTDDAAQAWTTAALLLGYWGLMTLVPVPGHGRGDLSPDGNLASFLDRKLLHGHMMDYTEDPEGLLATLPAIATSLIGVLAGDWLVKARGKRRVVLTLFVWGAAAAAAGWAWSCWFPLNKHIWTSSFALFTGGLALAGLALCHALFDTDAGWRAVITKPLEVFGRNPLISYFASGLFYGVQEFIPVHSGGASTSLKLWLTGHLFGTWLGPREASLAYALAYTGVCLGFMAILHRKKIYVKI